MPHIYRERVFSWTELSAKNARRVKASATGGNQPIRQCSYKLHISRSCWILSSSCTQFQLAVEKWAALSAKSLGKSQNFIIFLNAVTKGFGGWLDWYEYEDRYYSRVRLHRRFGRIKWVLRNRSFLPRSLSFQEESGVRIAKYRNTNRTLTAA